MMSDFAIDVTGLCKSFNGKVAVDNISIAQPKGSVWGFLGPNGSGKTTCIRLLCGLLQADKGEGQCLGFNFRQQSREIKRRTGYMTQHFSFWQDLTVRENLMFVAQLYNLPKARQLVAEQMETFGLTLRQHELAAALSGGWKQRLALAAVTLHRPQLLLLDEPTAGVDPRARQEFWAMIHDFSQLQDITVLVSTHYMDEAERCDHIVYLAYGQLLVQGRVDEIIYRSGLQARHSRLGDDVRQYLPILQADPNIERATFYGGRLHVVSRDPHLLDTALHRLYHHLEWEAETPTLDDAFISLELDSGGDKR
ncbi:ABC transporter ATP-binding protein [Pasteurella skyensis]|uniref:ABC transporter ATP-binding protein n=1 Tax=Phocoenobacter skyensis TaxID=97481 RepID=A0AAJ6P1F5_9PAST|nr:ABC transporter ATP-binding protein [Pasteurella skyensis]MDP8163387.1 ABC transporter ATP-binding protein [Pasteurella skyensis]MDP8170977.1 ABC transporter ATP-binding protein [Pasteurella skyensis]MDP8173629.1 ABC transporter ATP-binding protein [Pasteurella skyensis]MDP8175303.1 ABC transporter ATP-binding protein [Pasteurella skyensis]MDP8179833.1 ABC transporter ATP-binding protein [Pasteurella skyensis]